MSDMNVTMFDSRNQWQTGEQEEGDDSADQSHATKTSLEVLITFSYWDCEEERHRQNASVASLLGQQERG
jgi:hypothetical protein